MRKTAVEVALNLSTKVFAYYGLPMIPQSGNSREFVNSIVDKIVDDWPGEVTQSNGRPQHPQSQELIESGNAKVQKMLACRFHSKNSSSACMLWLLQIQCKLTFIQSCINDLGN